MNITAAFFRRRFPERDVLPGLRPGLRRASRGFTLPEIMIAVSISSVIAVGTISTFVFSLKALYGLDSEMRCRKDTVTIMDWLKTHIMEASSRSVYASSGALGTALDAGVWGRYLRFRDPINSVWHIVYWDSATRRLYHQQDATIPAPNTTQSSWPSPINKPYFANVDNFSIRINQDGTLTYTARIVPTNYFKHQTRANWVEMTSSIFARNYVAGD